MKHSKKIVLTWDEWSIEHIKKHKVNTTEIKEATKGKIVIRPSYSDRLAIYGITKKKRLLTVVLSFKIQKEGYIVSARDMNKKERKIYENEKN